MPEPSYDWSMFQYTQYFGRFQEVRGGIGGLPQWARFIVGIAAVPGLILAGLSILAFLVSLAALLLLTVPVYSVLRSITAGAVRTVPDEPLSPGTKRVEVTVVDRPV